MMNNLADSCLPRRIAYKAEKEYFIGLGAET